MMTIRDFDTGLIPWSQQKKTPLLPRSKFAYNRKKIKQLLSGCIPWQHSEDMAICQHDTGKL